MNEETIIHGGGAVKALGDGKVGGALVLYSSADDPDLTRDFFRRGASDFDVELPGAKSTVYYAHGLDPTMGVKRLGKVEMYDDDVAVWVEGQIKIADEFDEAVYDLAQKGRLGWSSGTASHLVQRKPEGKSSLITHWPLGLDASLTPKPAEPRNRCVALKSWIKSVPSLTDVIAGRTSPEPVADSLKAVYLGEDMESSLSMAAISRLNDALMFNVLYDVLGSYGPNAEKTLADKLTILRGAFDEFRDLALNVVEAIMTGLGEEDAADAAKSLRLFYPDPKAGVDAPRVVRLLAGHEFKSFLDVMGAVTKEFDRRLSWVHEQRAVKQGRALSADNLARLREAHDDMTRGTGKLRSLLEQHGVVLSPEPDAGRKQDADPDAVAEMVDSYHKMSLSKEMGEALTKWSLVHGGMLNL